LKKKFPESIPDIDAQVNWAKSIFKTPGQINWWINFFGDYLENKLTTKQLGDYAFNSIDNLQTELSHYFGFNYQPILTFVFDNKTVKQILTDLSNLEIQFKQKQEKETPVTIQEGDRKLYDFPDGTTWWFVNRAYCPEEGRSGKHCGNVVGKHKPEQRILSLRNKTGNVILTFILESDGTLGEMKAKGNQRPPPKYHKHIYTLLMGNKLQINGISGMGYLPEMNFDVFDFNEETLKDIFNKKRNLIETQLQVTPIDFLRAPIWIRQDPKLFDIAVTKMPGLKSLINKNGNVNTTNKAWESAIKSDINLLVNAPNTISDYYERMVNYIARYPQQLLKSPSELRSNFEFLKKVIDGSHEVIAYIMPTIPRYEELMIYAINQDLDAFWVIPEDFLTENICIAAVSIDGNLLESIPDEICTEKICFAAVNENGFAIGVVPAKFYTERLFLTAVTQNGAALEEIPQKFRTLTVCQAAIENDDEAWESVPLKIKRIINDEF
jgi:hypothetical protein